MKYFISSILLLIIGLSVSLYIGGIQALYIVFLLTVLEISLSFDNAVVNAKILKTMEEKWQQRFILYGMPIAVFGIRFVFPIVIVSIASGLGVYETFTLAIESPKDYHSTLESVKGLIYSFGGAFLLMVFLDFFFDKERDHQWIKIIEDNKVVKIFSKINNISIIIAVTIGLILISLTSNDSIAMAYFFGVLLHAVIVSIDELLNTGGVRSGLIGLLYLEVLDASFSLDGVIGAFALSSDIFIIMIGLGIGAMFVRSLTLYFVKEETLSEYKYLEHGAHYAILALAVIMFIKIFIPINEIIVGTIGVGFIATSIIHSIWEKRQKNILIPVQLVRCADDGKRVK